MAKAAYALISFSIPMSSGRVAGVNCSPLGRAFLDNVALPTTTYMLTNVSSNVALTISSPVPPGSHTVTVQSNALTCPAPVVNGTALLNVAILNP